jgi:hypothetical protein
MDIGKFITRRLEAWLGTERPPVRDFPLCDFERIRYELRPCDVLLVDGRSRASDVIKMVTLSPWSHAALYIGRLHDIEEELVQQRVAEFVGAECKEQLIIESELGLGAVVRPLAVYRPDHLRICRPRGLVMSDSQKIIARAVDNLGKPYDIRQALDLARFLLPWSILPRRWRSSLFARTAGGQTKTMCSTMIAEAFDAAEFPILPLVKRTESGAARLYRRNPKLCTPSDFDYSPHFEIIKYPFWDISNDVRHHLSPIARPSSLLLATDTAGLDPDEDGVFLPKWGALEQADDNGQAETTEPAETESAAAETVESICAVTASEPGGPGTTLAVADAELIETAERSRAQHGAARSEAESDS